MDKRIIHTVFEHQAERVPERVAVAAAGQQVTYRQVNTRANRLAHLLMALDGAKCNTVAVALPPGAPLVIALLATFKAGSVYLPMDLGFAPRRLTQMLQDCRPAVVITSPALRDPTLQLIAAAGIPVPYLVVLDDSGTATACRRASNGYEPLPNGSMPTAETNPEMRAEPDDSNYIFYTSGSTGEAKAIVGCHKGLAQFIAWETREFGLGEEVRVSQLTPVTFDASLRDIFVPLATGGALHIPTPEQRTNLAELAAWLESSGITLMHCVPSVMRLLTKHLQNTPAKGKYFERLRWALVAGEPLYVRDVLNWREAVGPHVELVNMYGLTETTLIKMFYRIGEVSGSPARLIPVGAPIDNTAVSIINHNRVCKAGEIGEVYIKTPYWTKGYLNNETLNRAVFVQNPLVTDRRDIVFKTGDLGRYLPDRNIELLGRTDQQVKVNGIRIELPEVERCVLEVAGIEQVLVIPWKDDEDRAALICYYVAPAHVTEATIRTHLRGVLNEHSTPAYFIELEELPLNANGKVDKKALPRPEEILKRQFGYDPPVNEAERRLAAIWEEVLGLKPIGRTSPFFSIGGTSLRAIQLISRVYKAFNVLITLRQLFNYPTIAQLAGVLAGGRPAAYETITPIEKKPFYEASHAQKRLWILNQFKDGQSAFNIATAYMLDGRLDQDALEAAFQALLLRHESLRTTFLLAEDELKQRVRDPDVLDARIKYCDLRPDPEREAKARRATDEEVSAPFDLAAGPLIRATLLRLEAEQHVFLLTLHHLIADGWSMALLIKELLTLYEAYSRRRPNPLPPLPIQYRDYAAWQNRQLSGDRLKEHQQYWRTVFNEEVPALQLPLDYPRPAVKTFAGQIFSCELDEKATKGLRAICDSSQASILTLLVALTNVLLYRYTGQRDIVIGTDLVGRHHQDLENQIGFYLNTIALRNQVQSDESFGAFLQQVKKGVLGAHEHQAYPFDRLVDDLNLVRDLSRSPLFDVFVLLQNVDLHRTDDEPDGIRVSRYSVADTVSKFDLSFVFYEYPDRLSLGIEFNTDLFKASTIEQVKDCFIHIVATVIANPDVPIKEISLPDGIPQGEGISNFTDSVESADFY